MSSGVGAVLVLALALLLASCQWPSGVVPTVAQDMLDTAGPQARRILRLGTFITVTATVTYLLVLAALALAAVRGRRRVRAGELADTSTESESRLARAVGIAVAATVLTLFVYLAASVRTGSALATSLVGPRPLVVEVTGHRWWWEVTYRDTAPSKRVSTANELHIPVGRPVRVILRASDVIHSLWVPNLHGKQDMIPGYLNATWLQADRPGVYRGQCAEYCGHQHAHMALTVVAEPEEKFNDWYERQLGSAHEPIDSSAKRGREVFLSNSCVMCHAIAGTPAGSRVGPDLTHFASRPTIAAGTLPNTRGHLAGWVVDPQSVKPGALMPPNQLSPNDLNALLDYLRSLK